jgi:two-component sensor histidine kinase
MGITPLSLGSFAVAIIALFSAVIQLVFALRMPSYRWGAWASGVGAATALFSYSVFLQYNTISLDTQVVLERLQLTAVVWLAVSLLGFTRGLLRMYRNPTTSVAIIAGIATTIIVWFSPGVLEPRLLGRRFFLSGFVYLEPALGPVGVAIFVASTLTAVLILLSMVRGLTTRGRGQAIVALGIAIWLATAINDLIGTLGRPIPHFLLEYGFLSFLVALLSLGISDHLKLHAVVLRQHRQIRRSRSALAQAVTDRTEELRKEVSEHLETEETLRESMADREVLMREIHHRSKNNLQIVSSLLRLAFEGIEEPAVVRIVQESNNRIDAMAMVHEQLYGSESLSEVDFADYLRGLLTHLSGVYSRPHLAVTLDFRADPVRLPIDRAVPLGLWANEAITNSYRHAFGSVDSGVLTVRLEKTGEEARLTVADDGPGLPPEHPLFSGPNGSADGLLHLGTYLLHDLPKQVGGRLELRGDSGMLLSVSLPVT